MTKILIKNGSLVNERMISHSDIFIDNGRIELIKENINKFADVVIDAKHNFVIPGVIDDHVHFREPGYEYKGTIKTESLAALYGGVTSYMDMPNTNPPVLDRDTLEKKYEIAARDSYVNYSFYMGASNDNVDEVLQIDNSKVCGVKMFLGTSTGNLVIDKEEAVETIFRESPSLIAAHCENDFIIKRNLEKYMKERGGFLDVTFHPKIRSVEACYCSTWQAVRMAKKYNTRLHVMHVSTADEVSLFKAHYDIRKKRITGEVCLSYLLFSDKDYYFLGNKIKCNPAIKTADDRDALWEALYYHQLDVIGSDHAPHTLEEKKRPYLQAPSGIPMVQHGLVALFQEELFSILSFPDIVRVMCHNPAEIFRIKDRGYLREGYWADIVIVKRREKWEVTKDNIYYKCKWSPLEGHTYSYKVDTVLVNGEIALHHGKLNPGVRGKRLEFEKER